MDLQSLALLVITFVAAVVNGALGYGFSSITVPLALLFLSNRVLNPALVLIEVVLNGYVLAANRAALGQAWPRVCPIVVGLVPGVVLGTLVVARVPPAWLRLYTLAGLLPLIMVQAAGLRRPLRGERAIGVPFGAAIGVLYSVTTISGPPLALLLNNQGFAKRDFRAALAIVRLAESVFTAVAYASVGLFVTQSARLLPAMLPGIIAGVPIGMRLLDGVRVETFRRFCMSFDAWIVGFGVSALLRELHIVDGHAAFLVLAAVLVVDGCLLYRFFVQPKVDVVRSAARA